MFPVPVLLDRYDPVGYNPSAYNPLRYFAEDRYSPLDVYYPFPSIGIPGYVQYEDLNYNSELRHRMTDFYYRKAVDHWLHDGFSDLLKYFRVKGDRVDIVDRPEDAKERELSDKERDAIIEFMQKYLLTKKFITKTLEKFIAKTVTNWYDLKQYKSYVKDMIRHELKKKIKDAIYEKRYDKSHKD
jgi:hypothetical protein